MIEIRLGIFMLTFESSTAAFSALPCSTLAQNGRNVTPRLLDFISAESSAQFTKKERLVPRIGDAIYDRALAAFTVFA